MALNCQFEMNNFENLWIPNFESMNLDPGCTTEPSFHSLDTVRSLSHFCDELLYDEGYHSVQSTFDSCVSHEMPATQAEYSNGYQTAYTPDPSTTHYSSVEGIPVANEMAIASAVQQLPRIFYTLKVLDQSVVMDKSSAGFTFHIPAGRGAKAADWGFSELLNKFYPNRERDCPVQFFTRIPAQYKGQYRIRVSVTYSRLEDFSEVVRRCPIHRKQDPKLTRLIQCDYPGVRFETCAKGHDSAILPFNSSSGDFLGLVANFSFACWNSCKGSINYRPLKLSFALETSSGQQVDEKIVDLKICSCPGRDMPKEENLFRNPKPKVRRPKKILKKRLV